MDEKFYSPPEAARQTRVSEQRVRSLCWRGAVPGAEQDEQGYWRIPAGSLGYLDTERTNSEWTQEEMNLVGTDSDARVGGMIGRSSEAVRDMRNRLDIPPFPIRADIEKQIPRMTTARLGEIAEAIRQELDRRKNA